MSAGSAARLVFAPTAVDEGIAAMPRRRRRRACCASAFLAVVAFGTACSQPQRPNVLMIVVDTLRKDELHVYGNAAPVSPAIDALAERGALFENHFTHASQTIPAMLSLLLSRLPADHVFVPTDPAASPKDRPYYPPSFVFLQEVFRDAGFATAGFTANPFLAASNGFDQGFEKFVSIQAPGEELNRAAIPWLAAQPRTRPFFLYLHYMDAHQPYEPSPHYAERFVMRGGGVVLDGNRVVPMANPHDIAYTRSAYAACVAHADDLVAEVLRKLDELGVRNDTLIVFTSDHGEEFGEHGGIGHGRTLYGEVVRVPLLMALPGRLEPGRRVAHLSQHLDLAPTILDLAGLDAPSEFQGKSVFEPAQRVFLHMGPWRGIAADGSKWLWNQVTGEQQLFALSDELDRTPRDEPEVAARLRSQLDPYLAFEASRDTEERQGRVGAAWSEAEMDRLRALGYAK